MGITIDNIENYMHLFDGKNANFGSPSYAEPIYAAMIRAYQNDAHLDITTGSEYIRTVILNDHKPNKTYSPVENIETHNRGHEAICSHLTDVMLQNFITLSQVDRKELKNYLQYLFSELMNNVSDHSHSSVGGYTMAQYFTSKKKIQFVVADRGVGFLENMRLNFTDVDNEFEAIQKALIKGITSTRARMYGAPKNAGFGLSAMFEILRMTGGSFVIISNDTLVRCDKDENITSKKLSTPWKGVVVAFEFYQSFIAHDFADFQRRFLVGDVLEEDEDFFKRIDAL